jgi:hypothetical protein
MLLTILIVLLIVALVGGGLGFPTYGYTGLSPVVIIIIILLLLWAFGLLR